MKILIVEDEKLLADSLKTLLESKGFDVETVYDGISGAEYDTELGFFHRDNGEYGECPANGSLAASQSETGFAIYGYSFVGWFRFRDL